METSSVKRPHVPIKERLLLRFGKAKEIVGIGWKDALARSDPFFNTREGEAYMRSVAQAYSDHKRGHVDRHQLTLLTSIYQNTKKPPFKDGFFSLHLKSE